MMKYLYALLFSFLFSFSLSGQELVHSSNYHLESIDCPENMICESRVGYNSTLIFFQIFDQEGRLHSEYLRTSDSTFLYKSFHLMDHFKLIKRPSTYGQKTRGALLISNKRVGEEKLAYCYDTYEPYQYHDTLLVPIGNWAVINSGHRLEESVSFNNEGERQGVWDSYNDGLKTIESTYEKDSLTNILYVDEMAREAKDREIIGRIQGTWYVNLKWENSHMAHLAIGQKRIENSFKYSRYSINGNELKIQSFKSGETVGKNKVYHISIKNNEWLVLKNNNQISEHKVLYLSDTKFHLLQPK